MSAKNLWSALLLFATTPAFAAGTALIGATTFKARCAACHSADAAKPKISAPTLAGVVGRKAGSLPQARYSPAMKASGLVWTATNLDKYLADPRSVVSGTSMLVKISNPQDRADVIAYLATLKGTAQK
jgi:cytochrome c